MEITTTKIYYTDIPQHISDRKKCVVSVFGGDCFLAAEQYANSVIHNFANNTIPGGPTSRFNQDGTLHSHNKSSRTQEDQIVEKYQQNLLLYPHMYPICDDSKINGEALLYSVCGIMKPIITIASPIKPNMQNKKTINTLINRIYLILYVCWKYNHTLITGLWGCGAFGANPADMAQIWQDAINTSRFLPERIVFAIIIDNYSNKWGNAQLVSKLIEQIKA